MFYKFTTMVGITFLAVLMTGCNANVPMSGKVTFSNDGAPLPQGIVFFQSAEGIARGDIHADGTYRIGSKKPGDGLKKGEYSVYVGGVIELQGEPTPDKIQQAKPMVNDKFTTAATSPVKINVDGSTSTFDFSVDRR